MRPRDIIKKLGVGHPQVYMNPLVDKGILEKRKINGKNKTAVGYFVVEGTS